MQSITEIVKLLYPYKSEITDHRYFNTVNAQPHITIGWISRQWFEELNYQIFEQFDTDFLKYSERLQHLPNVSRLMFSEGLNYNTSLLRELQNNVVHYALALYFIIRDQGFFELLARIEYVLHHPTVDGLTLYRGQTPYYIHRD
jgi:hypothetical protein